MGAPTLVKKSKGDLLEQKPEWDGSKSDYGNPESEDWQMYGQKHAQWIQALDRETYSKYGNSVNARTAYSMGARDMEAVRGVAVGMGTPTVITGHTTQYTNNDQSSYNSTYTGHYGNGQTRTSYGGSDLNGNEWDYTTYNLGDGSSYSVGYDGRKGTSEFETYTPGQMDYGKKLGMNTITAPKPIAPIK
jgi:hypothetical protein